MRLAEAIAPDRAAALQSTPWGLAPALKKRDRSGFAARYNGLCHASNKYEAKPADAFAGFSNGPMPDPDLRTAQLYLTLLGQDPGALDGNPGARARAAIIQFQRMHNLPDTGVLDTKLLALLVSELTVN